MQESRFGSLALADQVLSSQRQREVGDVRQASVRGGEGWGSQPASERRSEQGGSERPQRRSV